MPSIEKAGSTRQVHESIQEALTLIDIGQSFALANVSTAGLMRDLEKLLPEINAMKSHLDTLSSRMLPGAAIQAGSIWTNGPARFLVLGLANLDSTRQDDYPTLVFYRALEQGESGVRAAHQGDWQINHSLISLADPKVSVEHAIGTLEAMSEEIVAARGYTADEFSIRGVAHGLRKPIHALRTMMQALTDRSLPDGELGTGSQWMHRNGSRYTVLGSAEGGQRVVYRGDNGKTWSRLLSDWHRSMTPMRIEGVETLCAATRLK